MDAEESQVALQVPGYVPIVRSTDPSGHGSWMVGEECLPGQLVF